MEYSKGIELIAFGWLIFAVYTQMLPVVIQIASQAFKHGIYKASKSTVHVLLTCLKCTLFWTVLVGSDFDLVMACYASIAGQLIGRWI